MRIRVVSWNVHKCIGGVDRRYRPSRIVDTLAHHAPDIALLQEVANTAGRPEWDRQIDLLGDRLDFRHRSWFPNHRFRRGGEYGNAVLSRWAITDTENISLTPPGQKQRSVLHARIRVRTTARRSRTVHVFCLHLGLSGRARGRQLVRFLDSHPFRGLQASTPVIVAGDFNDVWGTLGRKHLEPAGFVGMTTRINTFPAIAPIRALDSIYVRGDIDLDRVQTSRLRLATRASDHLPLVAELVLRRGPNRPR